MAGTYVLGETKVRPGAYFNIQKKGTGQQSGTVSGVTAVLFRSDFGLLNTAVELNPDDGFANTFGNGGTTDAIQEAINGGAPNGSLSEMIATIIATTITRVIIIEAVSIIVTPLFH